MYTAFHKEGFILLQTVAKYCCIIFITKCSWCPKLTDRFGSPIVTLQWHNKWCKGLFSTDTLIRSETEITVHLNSTDTFQCVQECRACHSTNIMLYNITK